ncbi:MAG: efflux RND transporter periplasmic adaptor subunit [Candidatus Latescibacteria bacterium]|nr:efflux RND transporter periplasmic adaptor subunit [Candidatus Latescibacterota bacterium]
MLALTAVGLLGCGGGADPNAKETGPPTLMLSRADVATVTRGDVESGPAVSGVLAAAVIVDVKARIAGDVIAVSVQEGSAVKQGQSLAALDTRELEYQLQYAQAELTSAQVALKNAQSNLERTQRLLSEGAVAPRDLENAQAAVDAAQAQVTLRLARAHEMRKVVADAKFPSPITGIVSKRAVEPGDHVGENDVVLTVVDPSLMELTASISSEDLGQVRAGMPVSFRVEGYQGRRFEGKIARINPAADPATRQVTVYVQVPNSTHELIGGLFATGRIVTGRTANSLLVPADAIRPGGSGQVVYRVAGGQVTAVPVTPGLQDMATGRVGVTGGLQPGDLVLVGSATDIKSGTKVSLASADSTERRD